MSVHFGTSVAMPLKNVPNKYYKLLEERAIRYLDTVVRTGVIERSTFVLGPFLRTFDIWLPYKYYKYSYSVETQPYSDEMFEGALKILREKEDDIRAEFLEEDSRRKKLGFFDRMRGGTVRD